MKGSVGITVDESLNGSFPAVHGWVLIAMEFFGSLASQSFDMSVTLSRPANDRANGPDATNVIQIS
jgi:hypothetical protein